MKTTVVNCIKSWILVFSYIFLCFSTLKAQGTGPKEHISRSLYLFDKTCIFFENSFIRDSSIRFAPTYFQLPIQERKISVSGPLLKIKIFSKEQLEANKATILSAGFCHDTSNIDKPLFVLNEMLARIILNGQVITDWKPVTHFNQGTVEFIWQKNSSFSLFNDSLHENDRLIVELKNQRTEKAFARFNFFRISQPVAPFLPMFVHDTSSAKSASLFMQEQLARKETELANLGLFYQYWPNDYGSRGLNNEKCYEQSKLALYFRKPNNSFADSSLEYQLTSNASTDTTWYKTGHLLLITQMQPNKHYTLSVRYKDYPGQVQKNTFYVLPRWYQTGNFRIWLLLNIAIIIIVWLWIAYRKHLNKVKDKQERLSLELKAIRTQLNPHFIFNALSSIQGLVNNNEIGKANQYLSSFSSLLRDTLNNNDKEMQPLQSELKTVHTYLQLEQLRFQFQYQVQCDQGIDTASIEIPSFILQPLVENAVKHGVAALKDEGKIDIHISHSGKNLTMMISDNGKGFDPADTSAGHGLKLTSDKIVLLNKTLKQQPINLSIHSSTSRGTAVHLIFKNWL